MVEFHNMVEFHKMMDFHNMMKNLQNLRRRLKFKF